MGPAPLPGGSGKRRGDRVNEPGVGIGDHQAHAGKPSRDQAAKERCPASPVLGGVQVKAQDLPVAGGVHARGDHHRDVGDPAALADLLGERVEPDVRVGSSVERSGSEGLDHCVELLGPSARPGSWRSA